MKRIIIASAVVCLFLSALPSFAQTYKTVADTAALNNEYIKVTKDVADLNFKLNQAKNKQTENSKNAADANATAQAAVTKTSENANKTSDETVNDARQTKRAAKRSMRDAKDARHQNSRLKDSDNEVDKLSADLEKKQNRLAELDKMRSSIMSQ